MLLLLALFASGCTTVGPDAIGISVPHEIDTLDPHVKNTLGNFALVSHFYEPLVTTDAEIRLQPCLARLWENPDPSTWVFHLRPTARFHDGRLLRARDVVYSIERLKRDPSLEIGGYVHAISEVTALGEHTVRVRTERPLSVLLNKLRFVAIVPDGSGDSLRERPNGTGPYTLAGWDKQGQQVRLLRNPAYWGRSVELNEVVFHLDRSPAQAAEDLRSGRSQLSQ